MCSLNSEDSMVCGSVKMLEAVPKAVAKAAKSQILDCQANETIERTKELTISNGHEDNQRISPDDDN